jgi:hypothetical protein
MGDGRWEMGDGRRLRLPPPFHFHGEYLRQNEREQTKKGLWECGNWSGYSTSQETINNSL